MAQWRADGNCSDTHPGQACCPSGDDGGSLNGGLGQACYPQFLDPRSFFPSFFSVRLSLEFFTIPYDTLRYFPEKGKEVAVLFSSCFLVVGPWA